MYVQILGPLAVEAAGVPVTLGARRERQVLALLAASTNRTVPLDRIVGELWPADPPATPRHTVQSYVYRLRASLGGAADRIETTPHGYRLHLREHELDAGRFEDLASQAREPGIDPDTASALLATALGIWRGPAYADVVDLPTLMPERARLEMLRIAAIEDRFDAELALGRHRETISDLEVAVAEEPLRERLWSQLMLALYRSEQQADALAAFRRAKGILGDSLGIDPGPRLIDLEGRILLHDESLQLPGPLRNAETGSLLPEPRTRLIGRAREVETVRGLLGRERLVTITGAPGVGKTRVAFEVARLAKDDYPHGVHVVRLHETDEPGVVPSAIGAAVGLQTRDTNVAAALSAHLRTMRVLLVLDNLEHLTDAIPGIGHLLDSAPGVSVLTTSRVPTRLTGEHVFRLDPLPPTSDTASGLSGTPGPAALLFEDRARARSADFALTEANIDTVTEIVDCLDRLPLAIELAAARLGTVTLEQLSVRIGAALPLLNRGSVDGQHNHRGLAEAIAWSYELLAPAQRVVFRRLGVFRGTFTIEQAEHVADGASPSDVVNDLLDLVDANLVVAANDDGRFSLLHTLREFAMDSLRDAGEEELAERRLAGHLVVVAGAAESGLTGPDQAWWLARLEAEESNLRASLAWTRSHDPETGMLLASRIWRFWQFRGRLAEGRSWLGPMLEARDVELHTRVRGLIGLAGICYWQTDFATAEAAYVEAHTILGQADDTTLRAEVLFGWMQTLACAQGEVEAALTVGEELGALADSSENPLLAFMKVAASGAVHYYAQDWEAALPYLFLLLDITRSAGNRWLEREVLFGLASSSYFLDRHDEAEEYLNLALRIAHEMDHLPAVASALYWLALLAVRSGDAERGVLLAAAAGRMRAPETGGFSADDVGLVEMIDPVDLARESLDESSIDVAWARGWSLPFSEVINRITSERRY